MVKKKKKKNKNKTSRVSTCMTIITFIGSVLNVTVLVRYKQSQGKEI